MGAYSQFYIVKKLTNEVVAEVHKAYETREEADYHNGFFKVVGSKTDKLGLIYFYEINGEIYFRLTPDHPVLREKFLKEYKYGYNQEWFLPFTFEEMKVKKDRFLAMATIEDASNRLRDIPHKELQKDDLYWLARRDSMQWFLLDGHVVDRENDFIVFDSHDLFYDKDEDYIKQRINSSVKEIKQKLYIPHWNKKKS